MLLFKQKTNCTCGAAAYRSILSQFTLISEKQACDEVNTTNKGTLTSQVLKALIQRGLDANLVILNVDWEEYSKWLKYNSNGRLLYLSCVFYDKNGGKVGRNRERRHAIAVHNGFIYDPGLDSPIPIESFLDSWNKKVYIESMIMVDDK